MRILRIVAGFAMLLVGILGWLLPVVPGWPFVIPGLILLGREFHWARRTLAWLRNRLPKKFAEGSEVKDAAARTNSGGRLEK